MKFWIIFLKSRTTWKNVQVIITTKAGNILEKKNLYKASLVKKMILQPAYNGTILLNNKVLPPKHYPNENLMQCMNNICTLHSTLFFD